MENRDKNQARAAQSDESSDGRNRSRTGGYGFLEEGMAKLRPNRRVKNEGQGAQAEGAAWTKAPR